MFELPYQNFSDFLTENGLEITNGQYYNTLKEYFNSPIWREDGYHELKDFYNKSLPPEQNTVNATTTITQPSPCPSEEEAACLTSPNEPECQEYKSAQDKSIQDKNHLYSPSPIFPSLYNDTPRTLPKTSSRMQQDYFQANKREPYTPLRGPQPREEQTQQQHLTFPSSVIPNNLLYTNERDFAVFGHDNLPSGYPLDLDSRIWQAVETAEAEGRRRSRFLVPDWLPDQRRVLIHHHQATASVSLTGKSGKEKEGGGGGEGGGKKIGNRAPVVKMTSSSSSSFSTSTSSVLHPFVTAFTTNSSFSSFAAAAAAAAAATVDKSKTSTISHTTWSKEEKEKEKEKEQTQLFPTATTDKENPIFRFPTELDEEFVHEDEEETAEENAPGLKGRFARYQELRLRVAGPGVFSSTSTSTKKNG